MPEVPIVRVVVNIEPAAGVTDLTDLLVWIPYCGKTKLPIFFSLNSECLRLAGNRKYRASGLPYLIDDT